MNSLYYSRWRASHSGCPCLPVSERNYAHSSSAPLAVWRCEWGSVKVTDRPWRAQGRRRPTLRAATFPSVLPPFGNAAAGGEKTSQGCRVAQTKRPLSACSLRARSEPWWPTLCSVWGSHCYRDEARAKSHARGVTYFLLACESHNMIQFSVRRKQDLKDIFVLRWSHIIQFSFLFKSLMTLFRPGPSRASSHQWLESWRKGELQTEILQQWSLSQVWPAGKLAGFYINVSTAALLSRSCGNTASKRNSDNLGYVTLSQANCFCPS